MGSESIVPRSYFHRGGRRPLLGDTVPQYFARTVASFGDSEAVVSVHQGTRLTYSELDERVAQTARALLGTGYGRGDRVGLWSTNNTEWIVLQLATARIGAILVVLNPAYRATELEFALNRSQVQCLFLIPSFKTSDYVQMIRELVPELVDGRPGAVASERVPSLARVVLYDPACPGQTDRPDPGFSTWQEFLGDSLVTEHELDDATAGLDPDDGINIQYTSGTTGHPKPVLLTHHNLLNTGVLTAREMHFTEKDRLCVPVPFYHCFGMVLSNLMCLSSGACIVLPGEYFEAGAVLRAVESERCTGLHGVPTMFIAELEHEDFASTDCSSLRTGIMAGAPCPPPLMNRVISELHCPEILIGYGQTESSPLTHLTSRDDTLERRTETVGCNLPHQEVKVIDPETSDIVPCGETGEICFRGYHIMKEYYRDPEATAAAIDDAGWLHSGDLGWMDEQGLRADHRQAQRYDHPGWGEHLPG